MGHLMWAKEEMLQAKEACVLLVILLCTSGLASEVSEGDEQMGDPYRIEPRPVRFSFGLGKRSSASGKPNTIAVLLANMKGWGSAGPHGLFKRDPAMDEDMEDMEDGEDSEDIETNIDDADMEESLAFRLSPPKRSLYEGKGKRGPYAFGLGKRSSYGFGLGKRGSYDFGLGKRNSYGFGLGKRNSYGFGLGKRDPMELDADKRVFWEYDQRDPYGDPGRGKRSSKYGFGLGKRTVNVFGPGKRSPYGFGLGK